MARPLRIQYNGALCHVLSRGNAGEHVFKDPKDRLTFLDIIGNASERFSLDVFAYVLMDNHYHLLLRTNRTNLSKAMQWLGTTYTRRFNNRHHRNGHLFQGRFKSIIVENESYLVQLSCYIHRNPLRAKMVERLIEYSWSSYPAYAYGKRVPEWLNMSLILNRSNSKDKHKAYREKVQRYAKEESKLWEDFRHGFIIGTGEFVKQLRASYVTDEPDSDMPQQRSIYRSVDLLTLLDKWSTVLNVDTKKCEMPFGYLKQTRSAETC